MSEIEMSRNAEGKKEKARAPCSFLALVIDIGDDDVVVVAVQ